MTVSPRRKAQLANVRQGRVTVFYAWPFVKAARVSKILRNPCRTTRCTCCTQAPVQQLHSASCLASLAVSVLGSGHVAIQKCSNVR